MTKEKILIKLTGAKALLADYNKNFGSGMFERPVRTCLENIVEGLQKQYDQTQENE